MELRSWVARSGLILVSSVVPPAAAQEPELVTDRPDQTESSETVPPGRIQIEAGWTYASNSADPEVAVHELPGTLLRIGLLERLELRAGWSGWMLEDTTMAAGRSEGRTGSSDAELGAKFRLLSERGVRPQSALLLSTSLPTGSDEITSERADPELRLSCSHTLSDSTGLGYNLGVAWGSEPRTGGGSVTRSSYFYTLALGRSLTERLGTFLELFGEIPASAPGGPVHAWDGGFTYLLRDHLQLDVSAGVGLSAAADRWFTGAGISLRLPR